MNLSLLWVPLVPCTLVRALTTPFETGSLNLPQKFMETLLRETEAPFIRSSSPQRADMGKSRTGRIQIVVLTACFLAGETILWVWTRFLPFHGAQRPHL